MKPGTGDMNGIVPLLIDLQTRPERDVSLHSLAHASGYSPFHFQRLFTDAVGETPKDHVERGPSRTRGLRISVTRESILEIGLSIGYRSHETFSRAFRRRFETTPSAWRRCSLVAQKDRN